MKSMKQRWLILMAAGLLGSVAAAQASYVILQNNSRVDGTDIRANSRGEIILQTTAGSRTFPPGSYLKAVADKPPEFDQARQLAGQQKYDDAIKILTDLVARYRFLEWDNNSRALMAQIQVAKGDAAAAISTYDDLFRNSADAKNDSNILWAYRDALLKAKQFDKLEAALNEAISKGPRADAAKAQIMRGDIKLAQGQVEGAVLDYLRTVVLFKSEKEAQPAALLKAAQTLEKLRDARAGKLYAQLREEYPQSPEAAAAAGK